MMKRLMGWTLAAAALGLTGCASSGGVSCESLCEAREYACGDDRAWCLSTCRTAETLADRRGCGTELDAVSTCHYRNADVCGGSLASLCEPENDALASCTRRSCGATPLADECIETCTSLCYQRASDCGDYTSECASSCQEGAAFASSSECGPQYWAFLDCLAAHPLGTCTSDGVRAACGAEMDALDTCVDVPASPPTTDPPTTGAHMYETCASTGNCATGTCTTVSTSTARGQMCTQSCYAPADCPERDVACLTPDFATSYCFRTCYQDYDCPSGTYCEQLYDERAARYEYGCVPDL